MKKSTKICGLLCLCMGLTLLLAFKNQDKHKKIEVSQLSDNIWLMNDNGEATGYIVVGNDKAAVIDTMYGKENVQNVVRTVTELPLLVINTHGHLDHVYGNAYFDEVYIHPDDVSLAEESYRYPQYNKMRKKLKDVTFKTTEEGDSFDLGGITLEVYDIPGHTQGGICILDREDRVLFTGDSINRHCWMQLDSCTSMEDFYLALQRLNIIRTDYDHILHGHAQGFEDASLYEEHMAAVKEVIDGTNTASDEDYEYFGGTCKIHYSSENMGIVYNP
jgi:glyoxylase-like metal-dependent hydrolase (beta-lactamase superfamily II)